MTAFWQHPPACYVLLLLTGCAVSIVNSISGGGSVLVLPLLLWLGLPAAVANGTNRLGVWMGSLGSTAGFWRRGMVYPGLSLRIGIPGFLGAAAGSYLGVVLPDRAFKPVLAAVILFVVIQTVKPRRQGARIATEEALTLRSGFWPFLFYAGIGLYSGFIQAGVGLIMLYVFSRMGNLNLLQSNSLKVLNVFILTTLSLVIYGAFGKIRWDLAAALAAGTGVGGFMGSQLQIRRGENFVRIFLLVTGILLAIKLLFDAIRPLF